jgi:hypothetical protein
MSAIRGPVMLIILGVLLAVDHLGTVSIWRTWPVLLILLGVFKLLEHTGTPSA